MKCENCGKGPAEGTTIFRTTPKGLPPKWRCEKCIDPNKHPAPDKGTMDIVRMFENNRTAPGKEGE